ncbi:MAG: aquaporin [Phycisphaerales bacterium]|nr:aquaporin [Phycisphaerales bacterium]
MLQRCSQRVFGAAHVAHPGDPVVFGRDQLSIGDGTNFSKQKLLGEITASGDLPMRIGVCALGLSRSLRYAAALAFAFGGAALFCAASKEPVAMLSRSLIAEFVGTFGLCLVGAGVVCTDKWLGPAGTGLLGVALANGIVLSVLVSACLNISGGQFNPAVTIALALVGRMRIIPALCYVLVQLSGAAVAGLLLYMVIFNNTSGKADEDVIIATWNGTPHFVVEELVETGPPPGLEASSRPAEPSDADFATAAQKVIIIEAVITFLLMFVIYGTAIDPRRPNVGGFAIGLVVTANILFAGPLTGAAMNPARVLGTGFMLSESMFWRQHWVYWVGPLAGAIVAAVIYEFAVMDRKKGAQGASVAIST